MKKENIPTPQQTDPKTGTFKGTKKNSTNSKGNTPTGTFPKTGKIATLGKGGKATV